MFVAGFIGSPQMNFLDAKCIEKNGHIILQLGDYPISIPERKQKILKEKGYVGKTVVLGIRPEDLYVDNSSVEKFKNSMIQSQIRVYELLGAEVCLHFDFMGVTMTARVEADTPYRNGDTVTFALDPEKIHIFDKDTEITITN